MTLLGSATSRFGVSDMLEPGRLLGAIPAGMRVFLRSLSCYRQTQRERDFLLAMDRRALRDVGLTADDVASIARSLHWRQCWRWVRSCPLDRCKGSAICINECRPPDPRPNL